MARNRRAIDHELCERAIAWIGDGEPTESVARRFGLPLSTLRGICRREGFSPKATDDPARLKERERWRRAQAALRQRRQAS